MAAFAGVNVNFIFAQNEKIDRFSFLDVNKDLQNLVEAEKAFSAAAVKDGFRASFIQFFDDDGIGFGPHPEKTKGVLLKRPAPVAPAPNIFQWTPMYGDISLSGDYGYTTGPLLFTDRATPPKVLGNGMYFSVWKKQADGGWKVIIDMGVDTPEAVGPINTGFTTIVNPNGIGKNALKNLDAGNYDTLDAEFSADIEKNGLAKAYTARVNDAFRIHRRGMMPVLNKEGLKKFLESQSGKPAFKSIGGNISQSKDFAYTYGSFQAAAADGVKEGYYIHVWRRDKSKKWRLALDVVSDLPKKA